MTINFNKFSNKYYTANGQKRAFVKLKELNTLWFNTGTLCNIQCKGCYIESGPRNDKLLYMNYSDVKKYLLQISKSNLPVKNINFTGGEPFMNKDIIKILILCLKSNFSVLILTNAMQPLQKYSTKLLNLNKYKKLVIRVSLDHYTREKHELIRGKNTWEKALKGIDFLSKNNFCLHIASRLLWKNEDENQTRKGFQLLFKKLKLNIDALNKKELVLFPEMNNSKNISEITNSCWNSLKLNPNELMCSNSRMIIKKKTTGKTKVVACTLIPYSLEFELGNTLLSSNKKVYLNHVHCAKFCVLGGGKCQA